MKPEKQNLIHDLLDADSSREATLATGSRILRQRRHWRATRQVGIVALIAAVTITYLARAPRHSSTPLASRPASPPPGPQVHALTDDELLALFPNTPVGLASLSDGKKRLIFPRPGDEQRFITRL
jgi:hypothetical protein